MTFTQLRYFLGVIEHGGFARAAEKLFVAQSALSTQVKKLEEELGTPLLIRNGHSLELTAAGNLFLQHARSIASQVVDCKREIHNLVNEEVRGVIRLGISLSFSRMLTVPLLHAVQKDWPSISLHIRESLTTDTERALENGDLDVGIGLHFGDAVAVAKVDGNMGELLRSESVYVISKLENNERTGPPIHISELHKIPLLLTTERYALRPFLDSEVNRQPHHRSQRSPSANSQA